MSSVKQQDMPNSIVEWIIVGAMAIFTVVIYASVTGAFGLIGKVVKKMVGAVGSKPLAQPADGDDKVLSALAEPSGEASDGQVPVVTVSSIWDAEEPEASEIRRIELGRKGAVVFRFYARKGEVSGKLSVTQRSLKKALGETVQISTMPCTSLAQATELMTSRATAILQSATAVTSKQSKPSTSVREQDGPPDYLDVPPWAAFDDSPPHFAQDGDMREPPLSGCPADSPPAAPKPAPKRTGGPVAVKVKYRGRIISFGKEARRMDDETTKQHYCVRLFDDDLKAEVAHWGNDLRRAVSEAGVGIGDRVEMGVVGNVPVNIGNNGTSRKILWAMAKL